MLVGGGVEPDWTGTAWAWWWTWEALLRGLDPFSGTWNLLPIGQAPVAQYNLVDALAFGWGMHLIGPTRGYNLGCLLALATTGAAGLRLCRVAGAPWWAATAGGLALQCASFVATELGQGRVGQVMLAFFVLAFAELVRLGRDEGGRWQPVATGLLAALTALSYWFYALFLGIAALPFVAAGLWRRPRPVARRLAVAVATCLVLCAPAVLSLAAAGEALPGFGRPYTGGLPDPAWTGGKVGLAMAMSDSPAPWWPLHNLGSLPVDRRPGFVLLALVALGLAAPWRDRQRGRAAWAATLLLGYLFSLGPWPRISTDHWLPLPLPWLALETVFPVFERLWWPRRFEAVVLVAAVPLAALGLAELPRRRLAPLLALALFAELWLGLRLWPAKAEGPPHYDPLLYAELGTDAAGQPAGLLTLPLAAPLKDSRFALWMQVVHGHPISSGLGDHLDGHRSPAWVDWIDNNTVLDVIRDTAEDPLRARSHAPASFAALREDGLAWVVLDPQTLPAQGRAGWIRRYTQLLTALLGPPERSRPGGGARWRITVPPEPVRSPVLGPPPPLPPAN